MIKQKSSIININIITNVRLDAKLGKILFGRDAVFAGTFPLQRPARRGEVDLKFDFLMEVSYQTDS